MTIGTLAPVRPFTYTQDAAPAAPPAAPPAPADQAEVSKPAIDWKSVGKSAGIGALMYGGPAALAAIHPGLGIAGAVGLAAYACWQTKSPRGLVVGAFIGMPSVNLGMHWGFPGAALMGGLGALSLGLHDYLGQRRAG